MFDLTTRSYIIVLIPVYNTIIRWDQFFWTTILCVVKHDIVLI